MGASGPGFGGSTRGRGRRRQKRQPMAEINVTPFVDVMLVLLIIFMVTAPLLTTGVQVKLPDSEAKAEAQNSDAEPLIISVREDGRIFLQDSETTLDEIIEKLKFTAKGGYSQIIYVHGDAQANYGALIKVMGKISAAGYKKISLITNIKENS